MANYTITVYELERNGFDFGLDRYAIFDEEYRPILNNAILSHYRFREIGYANPALWRERLTARLDMIMRNKYNALYEAKKIEFNPLYNIDITETYTAENSNVSHGMNTVQSNVDSKDINTTAASATDTTKNDSLSLSSQFPSEEMTEDDLSSNLFVDSASKSKGNSTNASNSNSEMTNISENSVSQSTDGHTTSGGEMTYTRTQKGSSAGLPFSKAMIQLKDFYDKYQLDLEVCNELKDLFMTCW